MQYLFAPFIKLLSVIVISVVFSLAPATASGPPTADKKAIANAVFDYFEGLKSADYNRLEKAFHLKARMIKPDTDQSGQSQLKIWEIAPTIKRWSEGEPSVEPKKGKILNMHVMDGRLASVSFDFNGQFFDLLTLAKMDGQWKIINKAYVDQSAK